MNWKRVLFCVTASAWLAAVGRAGELLPPIKLTADGKPIDVGRIAHSAPFFGDYDGDGLADLLVGEFFEGRLRILRNVGSSVEARFDAYEWFMAGGELGRVPTG